MTSAWRAGAFLTAIPGASLVAMRHALRQIGAANGTVAISETLLDSKALWLTPNTDTVYAVKHKTSPLGDG